MAGEKQQGWPKEIVECMECGDWDTAPVFLRGRKTCTCGDRTHGPTCAVPVLPASASEPLVEALERIARCNDPAQPLSTKLIAEHAQAVLSDFKALPQEGE